MTKEEIIDVIANMTVLELADLVKALEEKFESRSCDCCSYSQMPEQPHRLRSVTVVLKSAGPKN